MLKKLILATAILALTNVAYANGAPYLGASVGVNTDTFKLTNDANDSLTFGGRGAVGNVFAGYGTMLTQSFYLGGEIFADLTSTSSDINIDSDNVNDSFKEKYGYGISLIPGLALSDQTMAYVRLGAVRSKFEVKETSPASATDSKTLNGAQFGFGIQTNLTQNVYLRGEYDFVTYRSATFNGNDTKPRTDQFNLGLIYKFE